MIEVIHFFVFELLLLSNDPRDILIYSVILIHNLAQCLKITEKVSFNIASEARYVYILTKVNQKCPLGSPNPKEVKQCYQTGHF